MASHDLCFTGPSLWPLMICVLQDLLYGLSRSVFYRTFFMASHDLCVTGPSLWPLMICVLQDLLYGLS